MAKRHARLPLRKLVFARDGGVCAKCKADCEKMRRVYLLLGFEAQMFYARAIGVVDDQKTFWDADHVHEIAGRGRDVLENIQTLCVGCHGEKTAAFMATHLIERNEPLTPKTILAKLEARGVGLSVRAENVLWYEYAFEPLTPEFKAAMINNRMGIITELRKCEGGRLRSPEYLGHVA